MPDEVPIQISAAPIRYGDRTIETLLDGMESLIVAASESMQHQTLSIVVDALTAAFAVAGPQSRDRIQQIMLTSLSALGDHLPTRQLEQSMERATRSLAADGRLEAAEQIEVAWQILASQRGQIKSRGNRDQDTPSS